MTATIVAIDPGKNGAWALHDGRSVIQHGRINTHEPTDVIQLCRDMMAAKARVLYLEDVHLAAVKLNPKSLLEHAKSIGMVRGIFLSHGFYRVELVLATTWQNHVCIVNGRKQSGKAASIHIAGLHGVQTKSHDVADAVLLSVYGADFERVMRKGGTE